MTDERNEREIEVGDSVWLDLGDNCPEMRVTTISGPSVTCIWFDKWNVLHSHTFNVDVLVPQEK